jgi:hypothetical protein
MMLSSSTRASSALAAVIALLLPALARAQQPAVPAVGEPPPPEARGQEEAAITQQSQQVYAATHQADLQREAARQVEAERRFAWEQRGRQNVPPPVVVRPPALSLGLTGRFGVGFKEGTEIPLGLVADLDLRMKWWGLGLNVGALSLRSGDNIRLDAAQTGAIITEASGYMVLVEKMSRPISASHGVLRFGHQLIIPVGQPSLPSAFLGFFAGIGGVVPIGPIVGGRGWAGFSYEFRLGYRFGLGAGIDSPIEGGFLDMLAGPVVGF